MPKFKPVRKKDKSLSAAAGGLPCLILVIAGLAMVMLFFYFVMKYSS